MTRFSSMASTALLCLAYSQAYAYCVPKAHFLLEGGGYYSAQGKSQFVKISGLIGDQFNVRNRNDTNTIFGVGYLLEGFKSDKYSVDYGLNAFYLAKTRVSGTIVQENLFTNLSYKYYVSHLPVYLFGKGYIYVSNSLAVTLDLGVGPNFMSTNLYQDTSMGSNTLPDNLYQGNYSNTTLTEMVGIGLKFNVMNQFPIEIGYRFFNLGEGTLKPRSSSVLSKLKTGNNTAQAIILTIST